MTLSMRWPNGLLHALTLSYDDGVDADIRLIEIMQKHGLKGTFNLNSNILLRQTDRNGAHGRLTVEEAKALYLPAGMEIAVHGAEHPFWARIPRNLCMADIMCDRVNLEKTFDVIVRGAAYPFGNHSDMTVDCLHDAGIAYCRTTAATRSFDVPKDWLRMPATCHHNDPALFELCEKFLDTPTRYPMARLFYLWGHSYEFDNNDNWNVIEAFCELMGHRENVYYATNIEIYDYVKAYESLHFSSEFKLVENPSAKDVWFELNGTTYKVEAGKTLAL